MYIYPACTLIYIKVKFENFDFSNLTLQVWVGRQLSVPHPEGQVGQRPVDRHAHKASILQFTADLENHATC